MLFSPTTLWWGSSLVVFIFLFAIFKQWRKYPHAPGPLLASFSNLWQARKMMQGHFEKDNIQLHKKHGKIVRVGPKDYSIDDPAATKTIYAHGAQYKKSEWYRAWQAPLEILEVNLFAQTDIRQHANARRRYASLYSMSSLVGYEPYVDHCIDIFCKKFDSCAQIGEGLDLTKWFQWYAFDVIGEITYSKRFGFMETETDVKGLVALLGTILEVSQIVGLFPVLLPLHYFIAKMGSKGTNVLVDFAADRIQDAKKLLSDDSADKADAAAIERQSTSPDFCSKLLALTGKYDPSKTGGLPADLFVTGACSSNLFAGSDTTSLTLTATYFNIVTRPEILFKLRTELDAAHGSGQLSDPPTFRETQQLPYLQAILKEALRLHPATGLPLWREVPKGGVTLCGTFFPEGTNLGVNSWVAHRNVDVWGEDAEEFRPERWLESSDEKLREMNASYMPFGLGARTCIGKNISLLEISKVIPQLVRRYDVRIGTAVEEGKGLATRCAWFVKQKEFVVYPRRREQSA